MAGTGAVLTAAMGTPLPVEGALWIVNPVAGPRNRAREQEERVRRDVPGARVHRTSGAGEAAEVARRAVRDGLHTVVVVGGDGTLTEVANAVLDEDRAGAVVVGFVPTGTCNDFARTREVTGDLGSLLAPARVRAIDVGRVTYAGPDGCESRWFVVNCSIGMVSAIGERFTRKGRLNMAMKRLSITLAQAVYAVESVLRWRRPTVRLALDSEQVVSDLTNLAVLKAPHYAGGLSFGSARTRLDDGRLEVVLIEGRPRTGVARILVRAFTNRLEGHPAIRSWLVQKLRVETGEPLPVEVDGEIVGRTPAEFTVLPRRLLTIT